MVTTLVIDEIASNLPVFEKKEQKQLFLFVLGGLASRLISLKKVAETMELAPDTLLTTLDLLGIDFSYLENLDIEIEKQWQDI